MSIGVYNEYINFFVNDKTEYKRINIGDILIDRMKEFDENLLLLDWVDETKEEDIMFCKVISEGNDGVCAFIKTKSKCYFGKSNKRGVSITYINVMKLIRESNNPLSYSLPISKVRLKDKIFYLFEWIDGELLGSIECGDFLNQIKWLHDKNFCHLDISPRNVIIRNRKLCLIDFNLVTEVGMFVTGPFPLDVSSDNVMNGGRVKKSDDNKGIVSVLNHFKGKGLELKYIGLTIDSFDEISIKYTGPKTVPNGRGFSCDNFCRTLCRRECLIITILFCFIPYLLCVKDDSCFESKYKKIICQQEFKFD